MVLNFNALFFVVWKTKFMLKEKCHSISFFHRKTKVSFCDLEVDFSLSCTNNFIEIADVAEPRTLVSPQYLCQTSLIFFCTHISSVLFLSSSNLKLYSYSYPEWSNDNVLMFIKFIVSYMTISAEEIASEIAFRWYWFSLCISPLGWSNITDAVN